MASRHSPPRQLHPGLVLVPVTLAALLAIPGDGAGRQQPRPDVLRIGATGTLTGNADDPREKAGVETLRRFIKEETGFDSEIPPHVTWQELADRMAKGEFHLGVFQGYEFAWAQEKRPGLKPLAIAVNVYRYPVAHVLARRDNPATDFAGLRSQSLCLPVTNQDFLRLFLDRRREANGKKAEAFFAKVTAAENVEDALDDVVDGKVQATVIDGAAFEAYRRRKPGRFKQLKEVARSAPFPAAVVASHGSVLDEATLRRFKDGLLGAAKKDKGEMLLTLSRLTGFEDVPEDYGKVLAATRKAYPPDAGAK
jgi:ABC-type phosphate/phosphonate transport system substrate-binding protein